MQRARARRAPAASYDEALFGKNKNPIWRWRWPALWGLLGGYAIQMLGGCLASLFTLFVLLAADPKRWPWAIGADSVKPLLAWMVGVGLGTKTCAWVMEDSTNPTTNWVIWGAPACMLESYLIERGLKI